MNEDVSVKTLQVDRKVIWYLQFIFESYDGIANVSTVDSREGIVALKIPAGREEEAELLLMSLRREIDLEELV